MYSLLWVNNDPRDTLYSDYFLTNYTQVLFIEKIEKLYAKDEVSYLDRSRAVTGLKISLKVC